jgi:6-pyruvoyltetrahydropterin/6-carboxytetrahydropterin synthase
VNVTLAKQYSFDAAHTTDAGGKRRLHGHTYTAEIVVAGAVDEAMGWLVDYGVITATFGPLYKALDHYLLDTVPDLKDVRTNGVREWILEQLRPSLPQLHDVRVTIVGDCAFIPVRLNANRMHFGFEAAHWLPRLPDTHKCKRMHGHSFMVDVDVEKDVETLEPLLREVYDALDHQNLNEIDGLENPTSEQVSRWIWNKLAKHRTDLRAVTVAETCTARCIYHGT